MPKLSEVYAQRLAARRREMAAKARAIGGAIDRAQKAVLGVKHPPASRPGQAPAMRTGRLRRESGVKVDESSGTVGLVNTAPYARYLRDGTRRMAARPYQDQVFRLARREITAIERRHLPFGGAP
jgi:hypothetical protein